MATSRKDTNLPALAARAERAKADGDPDGFITGLIGVRFQFPQNCIDLASPDYRKSAIFLV
jgi:hypothetical protein